MPELCPARSATEAFPLGADTPDAQPATRKCTVTLLVPTLNEIVGMKAIMPQIPREWVDQILILDGGSTDGTIEWARENGYEVHVQTERGIRQGYMEVLPKIRGDVVLTFSPDGNSIPDLLPQLIAKMDEGYDMVIASRYKPPAKSADDDWVTAFGNWLFTRTINVLHGGHTDAMVIYRAYRKQLIYDLELDQDRWYRTPEWLFRTRISWEPLLSARRTARRKLKVAEIPGDEPPRLGGERKLQVLQWGASYYFQFFRDFFLWR